MVLAAASLQEALEEVADSWQAQGHARPILSFAGTSSLARQVEAGAPADIFVSADAKWMDWLEERELIRPQSRIDLLTNRLVLASGDGNAAVWQTGQPLPALIGNNRIAVADTQAVPAGRYARAALEAIGAWDALQGQLVRTENVRAALALVERGEVRFGIVYATDALASEWVEVAGQFPAESHPPIVYPAALLAGSSNADAAGFLTFLQSAEANATFRSYGFGIAP